MKRFFYLPIIALVLSGCFKEFEGTNDENEVFARLAKGNGTWEVVQIEEWSLLDENPVIITTEPDSTFFHFYLRSKIVFGTVIDLKYGEYFIENSIADEATVSAQAERIVFEGNTVGSGSVFTVEKNTPNAQIWTYAENDYAKRYYLKKCNCEIPSLNNTESGG